MACGHPKPANTTSAYFMKTVVPVEELLLFDM